MSDMTMFFMMSGIFIFATIVSIIVMRDVSKPD